MAVWWNHKLMKWQVDEMESWGKWQVGKNASLKMIKWQKFYFGTILNQQNGNLIKLKV